MVAIGGSLTLYAIRAPALKGGGLFAPVSREGALLLNNLLLSCGCATVFLGTLYPLFLDVVGGPKLSVGSPFFNRTFVPLMVPLIAGGRHRPDAVLEARRPAGRAAAAVERRMSQRPSSVLVALLRHAWRPDPGGARPRPRRVDRYGRAGGIGRAGPPVPRPGRPTVCAARSICHAPPMA